MQPSVRRAPSRLLRAVLRTEHYRSTLTALIRMRRPLSYLTRYALLGRGQYPTTIEVRTPIGIVSLVAKTWHDLLTIHEIFCVGDYQARPSDKVIVDFGSNIGISAAYFLSRSKDSFAYLFEPLPQNVETLRANLRQFAGRYSISEVAVGLENGQSEFGWEPSGRYGGLGQKTDRQITVKVRKSTDILKGVIDERGKIDILKIDVETLEKELTENIEAPIAEKVGVLFVEYPFKSNPLRATHRMTGTRSISRFVRTASSLVSLLGYSGWDLMVNCSAWDLLV